MRAWVCAALAAVLAGCVGLRPVIIHRLTPEQVGRTLPMPGTYVLDVSPPADYEEWHLPDARSIPYSQLWYRMDELPTDREAPILVYDADGERSMRASFKLREEGYNRVYELIGGRAIWKAKGFPVSKDPAPPVMFEGGWKP